MITPQWVDRLQRSAATHGETFLHHLHVGIASAERRNFDAAVKSFEKSIALRPTAVAHRNLAVILDDIADRATHYQAAWTIAVAADLTHDPAGGHLQVCVYATKCIFARIIMSLAMVNLIPECIILTEHP